MSTLNERDVADIKEILSGLAEVLKEDGDIRIYTPEEEARLEAEEAAEEAAEAAALAET